MKVAGADGFIKFALGENVKQANWGDNATVRYPQTRMGVEQVFRDYFTRAKAYDADKNPLKRRDLDLETVAEILNKKRFITCHSYVQSEILMLMKVAEDFNFRINTFTHILEGYKVAKQMKAHGVYASTFADWWAYKMEVQEAIPYNGAILHEQGVTVGFNSDDAEMGRRLNQEAAKAIEFGGVKEEEALKFVTLNPAKMLHLDNEMGSIKKGKSADIVLWNKHPLSVYARAEYTFIDGIKFFDRKQDAQKQLELAVERNRLIQKLVKEKQGGAPTQPVVVKKQHLYECDDVEHE
jgi:imidazolonepropionase-like amidohydrolase